MTVEEIHQSLIDTIEKLIALLQKHQAALAATPAPAPQPVPTPDSPIFTIAKSCLNTHITLDDTVPAELGCAEAVSYVLLKAGFTGLPAAGIAGTAALYAWLQSNFTQVQTPLPGDVIISPTGYSSKGSAHGHVGIVAKFGVLSNDSDTGLFLEKYTLDTWKQYFGTIEGFPTFYFRPKNLV